MSVGMIVLCSFRLFFWYLVKCIPRSFSFNLLWYTLSVSLSAGVEYVLEGRKEDICMPINVLKRLCFDSSWLAVLFLFDSF